MEEAALEALAETGYEAYLTAFGTVIPPWGVLPEEHKKAWRAVVEAVQPSPEEPAP